MNPSGANGFTQAEKRDTFVGTKRKRNNAINCLGEGGVKGSSNSGEIDLEGGLRSALCTLQGDRKRAVEFLSGTATNNNDSQP